MGKLRFREVRYFPQGHTAVLERTGSQAPRWLFLPSTTALFSSSMSPPLHFASYPPPGHILSCAPDAHTPSVLVLQMPHAAWLESTPVGPYRRWPDPPSCWLASPGEALSTRGCASTASFSPVTGAPSCGNEGKIPRDLRCFGT